MTALINYSVEENIAVISLQSPPVNGLGQRLRAAIFNAYLQASKDSKVEAIVIASTANVFCAGADISEFGTEQALASPSLPDLCHVIEDSSKPVIAAVNGMALGGGFELTLACDFIIALPQAQFGLPEVKLGILPGAGGTQRLPRIAGAELALQMMISGTPISAEKALAAGIVDCVHAGESDFIDMAIGYAQHLIDADIVLRNCARLKVDTSQLPDNFFSGFRASIARRSRGFMAPEKIIQCVQAACELPFSAGLQLEASLFQECIQSPQARAQQHIFFAERAAKKVPGIKPGTASRDINKVAVIGAGTMGGGIAMNFASAGIATLILDLSEQALERGLNTIKSHYLASVQKGKLTEAQMEQCLSKLAVSTDYNDIQDADLVIEAVFEEMQIKQRVFKKLDEICQAGAILATNTSTLDVNDIAAVTQRPSDVIGLHFFSPANVMRLLEIVRGKHTADDVIVSMISMAQRINKVPVVAGVCWGFIGNRMLEPYAREASRLILEGASPEQIDNVLCQFGMAMGFPSMIDLAGIDVGYLTRQGNKQAFYARDPSYAAICDKLYELGHHGQKTARGFYLYDGRDKRANTQVTQLAAQLAQQYGIKQRQIPDQEILQRTLYMLVNEGAQVLDEGIACRSSDIDTVYCNGYGFPTFRGGPMQYADEIGLDNILSAINRYQIELGEYGRQWFTPAPLLEKLVAEGKSFKTYINNESH
ncbi:3-hydroxyacyl-CoA dehydrogenase NAD-binding domain-containing protein [Neptunicella sp.]|uniref:3-hydroxyacyl-CoA dehydrogenase NAD-binding domain-containing protein n=1 Tax=Neptunicella sp. TaxID=2125986 RepID=UPI003F68E8CD